MKKWVTKGGYTVHKVLSGRSNVFLITNDIDNFLVDTSTASNYMSLDKALKNLYCSRISLLILTHAHFDHAANASSIKQQYNTKIIAHSNEIDCVESGSGTLPKGTNAFTKFGINLLGDKIVPFFKYKAVKSDIAVDDSYDLKKYGLNAYIMHTPGHTSGSISIIVDGEVAIVGDAMFGVFKNSVFPPFADDTITMIDSWGKLLNTGCRIFLPSHGSERTDALLKSQYQKYKIKYT